MKIPNSDLLDNNSANIEKTWYKSGLFWTKFSIVVTILGIIVAIIVLLLPNPEVAKSKTEIIDTSRSQTDEIKEYFLDLHDSGIQEMKEDRKLYQEQLKQQISRDEYENDNIKFQKKLDDFKKLENLLKKGLIDSAYRENQVIVQNIKYIRSSEWSKIFNAGFGVFKIGAEKKIYISYNNYDSPVQINWKDLKLLSVSENSVQFEIPTVVNKGYFIKVVNNKIHRGYNYLNRINYLQTVDSVYLYTGIISDNENGIIGIIGFSKNPSKTQEDRLIDFESLQKFTGINFKGEELI